MITYNGKYAEATVFVDAIEETAVQQIYSFLNCPAFENCKIRIMPDVHAGAGAVIGFTSTLNPDMVIPNVVGVDINCGMLSLELGDLPISFESLDQFIRANIPNGCRVNEAIDYDAVKGIKDVVDLDSAIRETNQDLPYVYRSIGSLGGGNHFIEIGIDDNGCKHLTIHSGSRNFGLQIAKHHQRIAKEQNPFGNLSWCSGDKAKDYLRHMQVAAVFASFSRKAMMARIAEHLGVTAKFPTECVHNYIDINNKIIRKGAISANLGEAVIIPWNMRDGMIFGRGKGNGEWNNSAPHGAGRIMGRNQAKKTLNVEEFKNTMQGVWSSCVGPQTLDESPMAYKDPSQVQTHLSETIDIAARVRPIYNFKAS